MTEPRLDQLDDISVGPTRNAIALRIEALRISFRDTAYCPSIRRDDRMRGQSLRPLTPFGIVVQYGIAQRLAFHPGKPGSFRPRYVFQRIGNGAGP